MAVVISKAAPPDDPILAVAERMEGKIRDAFISAVAAVQNEYTLKELASALQSGSAEQAIALLDIQGKFTAALEGVGIAAGQQSVRDALQATYAAGATAAATALPPAVGTQLSFDLLNPESVRFLQSYTFDLIQQVSTQTVDAVRQIILRGFQQGNAPIVQAREIREVIGLTARMEQAVANFRSGLESGTSADLRTILDRVLRDGRYDRTVMRAINGSTKLSQAQIDKMVSRYRQRYLKYRAENIARSESLRASNSGQLALWRKAVQSGLIPPTAKRKWLVSGDERTCPRCLYLDGMTAGIDEPFDADNEPVMQPPEHPSCRCSTSLVSSSLKTSRAA